MPGWTPSELDIRSGALVRASTDVLYQMSPDWSEMRQLTGGGFLRDTDEPLASWRDTYIHPDDRSEVDAAIAAAIAARRVFELEHRVIRADGTLGWTVSRAVPIVGDDGTVVEWFGSATDVTDRRNAAAELAAAHAAALHERERRAQLEQEFVANAAHELRTPVTAIAAAVDALATGGLADDRRARLHGHLQREAERLARLCDTLLLLAQVDSSVPRRVETVEIEALLRDVVERAPAHGAETVVDVDGAPRASLDRGLLELIVANLHDNAVKHGGGGTVWLRARTHAEELRIEVADAGAGFSDRAAEHRHERFFRDAGPDVDGFGLGLAIAHRAAEAIGATIDVRSAGGRTFVCVTVALRASVTA